MTETREESMEQSTTYISFAKYHVKLVGSVQKYFIILRTHQDLSKNVHLGASTNALKYYNAR